MAKRGGDIAGEIRGAFIRAVKIMDEDPVYQNLAFGDEGALSTLMRKSLDEDFKGTLNALKGFVPKEAFLSTDSISYEEWLEELEAEDD